MAVYTMVMSALTRDRDRLRCTHPTDIEAEVPRLPLLLNSQCNSDIMAQQDSGSIVLRQRRTGQNPPGSPAVRERPRGSQDNTDVCFTNFPCKQMRLIRTSESELDGLSAALLHLLLELDERRHNVSALDRNDEWDLALGDVSEDPLGFALAVTEKQVPEGSDLRADTRTACIDSHMDGCDPLEDRTLGKLVRSTRAECDSQPCNKPSGVRSGDTDGCAIAIGNPEVAG